MNCLPTLYEDYQEFLVDMDSYGSYVSVRQRSLDEVKELVYNDFKEKYSKPSLDFKRFELSGLVSNNYKVIYNNDLKLANSEHIIDLNNNNSAELLDFNDITKIAESVEELFSYQNSVTSDIREELINKYELESGELLESYQAELAENVYGTADEDTTLVLSDEAIENLGKDVVESDTDLEFNPISEDEDFNNEESISDNEIDEENTSSYVESKNTTLESLDLISKQDEYSEEDEGFEEDEDFEEDDDFDDSLEDDSEDDDFDDSLDDDSEDDDFDDSLDDDYEDEDFDDSLEDDEGFDDNLDEDSEEDDDFDDSLDEDDDFEDSLDNDDFDDSLDDDFDDSLEEKNKSKNKNSSENRIIKKDEDFFNDLDEPDFVEKKLQKKKKKVSEIQEPILDVENTVRTIKVHEPRAKPVTQIESIEPEPTDIRKFIRKHPRCDYDFALKYFTKKQINDAIKVGKIVKKGNILKL